MKQALRSERYRIVIFGGGALAMLFGIYSVFSGYLWALTQDLSIPQHRDLEFTFQQLQASQRPTNYPQLDDPRWLKDDTVEISVVIPANYGAVRWCGDYVLSDGVLTLKYGNLLNEFLASGWRPVRLTYVIRNIPKGNYTVKVEESDTVIRHW